MKPLRLPFAVAAVLTLALAGCSSYVPPDEPVSMLMVPAATPREKVRAAVKAAAAERGWHFVAETETKLDLTYKKQTARVVFDAQGVRLYQTGGDRDVRGWLTKLAVKIDEQLAK